MTSLEIALLGAFAVLIYQEIWWRDRLRRVEADHQKRVSEERVLAFAASAEEDEGPIRSFTFHAQKLEASGLFREVTRPLFIDLTMAGENILHAAGDLAEIDRFDLPPGMKRALLEYVAPEAQAAAGASGLWRRP